MEAQNAAVQSSNIVTGIIHAFQLGGFTSFLIALMLLTGILAIVIVFERYSRLKKLNVDGASFMFEVQKYILSNDVDGAIRVCNGAQDTALSKVLKSGLQRASRDEQQIQNAIDSTSLEMIPKLEKNLTYLATIANIATLLGLLGTISGLIKAFAAVGLADPAQRQNILANGISEAMNATALGLFIAIFAMVCHSILTTKAQKIIEEIDEFGVKLLDLLSARKFQHSSEK